MTNNDLLKSELKDALKYLMGLPSRDAIFKDKAIKQQIGLLRALGLIDELQEYELLAKKTKYSFCCNTEEEKVEVEHEFYILIDSMLS